MKLKEFAIILESGFGDSYKIAYLDHNLEETDNKNNALWMTEEDADAKCAELNVNNDGKYSVGINHCI